MITFKSAERADLDAMLDWAAGEGWNPGLGDADAFFAADPAGFFVAVEDDRPVGCISVVNHCSAFAFLGLYILCPAYRGRGIGLRLWTHALVHAGDRVIGLDGVAEQQSNYQKSGFVLAGGTTRFSGPLEGSADARIRPARSDDVDQLVQIEAQASGIEKPEYLGAWFSDTADRRTFVMTTGQGIKGAFTVRLCRSGAKVGPFWAEDAATAEAMLNQAATVFPGEITVDVPAIAAPLQDLCRAAGLEAGFETARMYKGMPPPPAGSAAFFAVTSLELG